MSKHLIHEVEELKRRILELGARVEANLSRAVTAIEAPDARLAQEVVEGDAAIDEMEVAVEEEGLKVLALHQPVAIDLRFIVAVLKINSDLERIGDLAVNMAERAMALSEMTMPDLPLDFRRMAAQVQAMLRQALDALVNLDPGLAREVCAADDEVDAMNREMYEHIQDGLRQYPDKIAPLIHLMSTSRQLERIADHATNIAEDVIYMVQGDIVRHHVAEHP